MYYKFCPKCASDLTEVDHNGQSVPQCTSCGFFFYQNSKPTASALILDGDKILLGKHAIEPFKGMWDILGGYLYFGEHPSAGVKREILEETGLQIGITDMLGFFMDTYGEYDQTLNIYYVAKIVGGQPVAGDDVAELRWFNISEPPKEFAFKNSYEMFGALRRYLSNK